MTHHQITIEPTTVCGERGQRYRVKYQGAIIVHETWSPELEAARALLARGIVGRLEIWRSGKGYPDMLIADISKAAGLSVEENENGVHGLRGGGRDRRISRGMPVPCRPRCCQRPF